MKRKKKLLSLLLVLALILGATYAVTLWNPEDQETDESTTATVFTLDPEAVTALSWDYSEPVSFEKIDGEWVYTEDEAFPLDSSYIDTILATLAVVTSGKTIENVENWDQYTLEAPICAISVTADGVTHSLKIGQESALGGERYFSVGDGNAYLIDSTVLDVFSYGLYDLLSYEAIPDMSDVRGIILVSDQQSYEISYLENSKLVYSDDYVWFMDGKALDTELTEALVSNMTSLSWGECVNFNAADVSEYGLDAPSAVVTVSYGEDGVFSLEIGAETGDYRYARIEGSNMVYKIDAAIADTLMYTTYYELQPDEVLLMDWDTVTSVDVTLDGSTYEITREIQSVTDDEGNTSESLIWTLNGETVALDTVTGIIDSMISSGYATGLTPESGEEIQLVIHREHETFPEVTLSFHKYDSASCMTTLNGNATVFTDRETVATLVEAVRSMVSG